MISGTTVLCIFCACLFWAVNAIEIVIGFQKSAQFSTIDRETYKQLLPDFIADDWYEKIDTRALYLASGFLKGTFWIVFCLPIIEMAWVLSKGGKCGLVWNLGIILFVLGGSWTKWFSAIFWNGMYISFLQISKNFNLDVWLSTLLAEQYQIDGEDGIGWRALEVNYMVSRGLVWIVNAVEWLCLAAIFSFTFVSVFQWRKTDETSFGAKWNALGLFIGMLAIVEFVAEIIGFEGYRVAWIFVVLYAALNRLILVPIWIIILGFQLPNASTKEVDTLFDESYNNTELQLSEQQQQPQRRASEFTIDDNDDTTPAGPTSPPAAAFTANELVDSQKS
jgi:hypothetical protein